MNHFWFWLLLTFLAIGILAIVFVVIARKGRQLRRSQPLPPEATKAFLRWIQDGEPHNIEIEPPFYFGKDPECNIVLPRARAAYEVCIFYHKSRFALQALPDAGEFSVNGEDAMAGYLRDGDTLFIAKQSFTFRCY